MCTTLAMFSERLLLPLYNSNSSKAHSAFLLTDSSQTINALEKAYSMKRRIYFTYVEMNNGIQHYEFLQIVLLSVYDTLRCA